MAQAKENIKVKIEVGGWWLVDGGWGKVYFSALSVTDSVTDSHTVN